MKRATMLLSYAMATLVAINLTAETSKHQRVGVERERPFLLYPGLSLTAFDSSTDYYPSITAIQTASAELTIRNAYSLSVSVPFHARVGTNNAGYPPGITAFGDPEFNAGWNGRTGDWKLTGNAGLSFPAGIWNPYETAMKRLSTGSGYHQITLSFTGTRFLDPTALTAGCTATTTLPREERDGRFWRPLEVSFPLSVTFAANSHLAFSAGIVPNFSLPTRVDGIPESSGIRTGLTGNCSIGISEDKNAFGIQLSQSLHVPDALPSLTFYYIRTIVLEGKHHPEVLK